MIMPHATTEEAVAGSAKDPRLQGVKESTANQTLIQKSVNGD